jgi:hypothetical protein
MEDAPAEGLAEGDGKAERSGIGCALSILAVNAVVIGFLASSFAEGPYSSLGQELWYRYGSLGFLLSGVILPAIALLLGASRSRGATIALTIWMMVTLFLCFGYALNSGGGV